MRTSWTCSGLWAALAIVAAAGCNLRPAPPATATGLHPQAVAVTSGDAPEAAAAEAMFQAQAEYKQALKVIHAYYERTGDIDKQGWAESELENLAKARTWRYEGIVEPQDLPAQQVMDVSEAALAERILAARRKWQQTLADLIALYDKQGHSFKRDLVRNVQRRFQPEKTYSYFLSAEVPPETLRPTEVIPAADELFDEALRLHKQGKPLPLLTSYRKQRQALLLFLDLIQKYPTSIRIAEAAYYIGDIYKEYFNENVRAVSWYERAWQWDPNIQHPARSQAAYLYDFRLGQPGKALPLYHESIKHEQYDQGRIRYAYQRIDELTKK